MKVTAIKTFVCNAFRTNFVFVKVETDSGLYGWGEATLEYKEHTVEAAIHDLEGYLIGKDPRNIEAFRHDCYRDAYWRGGPVLMSALAGVEIAGPAETEALVSDVFLALWRSRAKLRDEGIASYLIAIARNRAGSYLRKKRREIPVDPADMTETPDNGELPEDAAERKILAESLLEALDEETRKLFVRHYYFGQTVEDASRELGMNLSTAKSRLVRGREKLNRLLEGENKRERRREKRHGNAF